MQDLSGITLGNYEILEKLGRGGMANVYKAFHPGLAVHRAIKVIRPDLSGSKNFDERFQREARAVAGLRHPNIVQMHDFGRHEDLFYMVMEFVEGEDLKARIKRDGPIRPFSEAIRIVEQLTAGLGYAHQQGVLHRDVKPDNVMLGTDGSVILTDFGIAKIVDSGDPALTAAGAEIGTPAYMAPETVMGRESATPASDLYAVGVVLYEMLTAHAPFAADTPLAVLHKVVHDPVPPPRDFTADIPDALQGVVLKAMAFEPGQRYPSAEALIEACRQSLLGIAPDPVPDPTTRPMLARSTAAQAATEPVLAGTVVSEPPSETPSEPTVLSESPVSENPVSEDPVSEDPVSEDPVPTDSVPQPPIPATTPGDGATAEPPPPPVATPAAATPATSGGGARKGLLVAATIALVMLALGVTAAWLGWRWWQAQEFDDVLALFGAEEAAESAPIEAPATVDEEDPSTGLSTPAVEEPGQEPQPEAAIAETALPVTEEPGAEAEAAVEPETFSGEPLASATQAPSVPATGSPAASARPDRGRQQEPEVLSVPDGAEIVSDDTRERAGLGTTPSDLPTLPLTVREGGRVYSGGEIAFGRARGGRLEPEDMVVYDLEVRRPGYIYFDIVFMSRPATFTLFDADGNEVFRQGSDLGPHRMEEAGWYRLAIETEATIPIDYEVQFLQVGD